MDLVGENLGKHVGKFLVSFDGIKSRFSSHHVSSFYHFDKIFESCLFYGGRFEGFLDIFKQIFFLF